MEDERYDNFQTIIDINCKKHVHQNMRTLSTDLLNYS